MKNNIRKILGDVDRPYLSNDDRQKRGKHLTDKYQEEKHHAYTKCTGGTEKAIVKLFSPVHYANHRLFGVCNLTQKFLILALMDEKILNEDFVEEFTDTVNKRDDEYVYKNGVYVKRHG